MTLKTIEPHLIDENTDPQVILNTVVSLIVKQGKPSFDKSKMINGNNGCLYRGPNGTKCAAGQLITDEEYDPEMEGKGFALLNTMMPPRLIPHKDLIRFLQYSHDSAAKDQQNYFIDHFLENIETHFEETKYENLIIPTLEEINNVK